MAFYVFPGETVECIWRSSHFRTAIRTKFEEALRDHKQDLDPFAIEAQLFAKAKTKDEYLELSARVIIHIKHAKNEKSKKRKLDQGSEEMTHKKQQKLD